MKLLQRTLRSSTTTAGLAHQQVNPAWYTHGQQDVSYHSSSGTGVYWPQMDVGAAMQTHGRTGPVVGAGYPGYQSWAKLS